MKEVQILNLSVTEERGRGQHLKLTFAKYASWQICDPAASTW